MIMKKIMVFSLVALSVTGCESISSVTTMLALSDTPLARASVQSGATSQDILNVEKPEKITKITNGQGACFDYTMQAKGRTSPYHVAFNSNDRVMSYGWFTCANAEAKGLFKSNEAMKQIY